MKILFVREKFADARPELGLSDGSYAIPTLERHGLGNARVFYYDEYMHQTPGSSPDVALGTCVDVESPDVIMFSQLISLGDKNIKAETYKKFRDSGVKTIGVWHEGVAPHVVQVADTFIEAEAVDFNLFLDTRKQFERATKFPDRCLGLYDPRDPETFKPDDCERVIPVSFIGTLVGRYHRLAGLYTLLGNNIPVTKLGGRREWMVSEETMIKVLQRSKIAVNFADAGQFTHYKGRVAEACLSGAMLMEQVNEETPNILDPMRDYVPFSDPEDLLKKVVYYLNHEDERAKISERGRQKVLENLDGRKFWAAIFKRLEACQ